MVWIGIILTLLFSAALSAARAALVNARKVRLHQMAERGVRGAARAERVAANSSRLLATIQVGRMLANTLGIVIAAAGLLPDLTAWLGQSAPVQPYALPLAVALLVLSAGLVLLWLGDLLPAMLAVRHPEQVALVIALPVDLLATLFAPLVNVISSMAGLITVPTGGGQSMPFVTEEEIKTLVDAGEEKGEIEEDEKDMIYSVFEFGDTLAREVMVPRVDMLALAVETPLTEAVDQMIAAGHSRVPVFSGSIDNILGLVYAKDMLRQYRQGLESATLRDLLRPVHFVPEAKKIDELLRELQIKKTHMAVVVDEYGGVAGLVTVEDILEEIVGELQDEYDVGEEPDTQELGPYDYVFAGRVSLDEVAEALDTWLDPEQGETLGGFVYSQLGKVPSAGEKLVVNGLELEVLAVNGRRVQKVHVRRVPGVSPDAPDSGAANSPVRGAR